MSQTIVEQKAAPEPPTFSIPQADKRTTRDPGEVEWMRNSLGADTKVVVSVTGDMGPREISKLITLLEAQRAVLED